MRIFQDDIASFIGIKVRKDDICVYPNKNLSNRGLSQIQLLIEEVFFVFFNSSEGSYWVLLKLLLRYLI